MADENGNGALQQFKDGVLSDNPVLVQLLGMCPTLAITNSVENALVMGAAASFVVICSNMITSLLRPLIHPHVRILIFTLTIATFVTLADRFLAANMYKVSKQLGAFIPLIIVNCMIICRAEVCAIKSGPLKSFCDACGIGIGFTMALVILGVVREILGNGTLLNYRIMPEAFYGTHEWVIMVLPPGAFLVLGIVIGVSNFIRQDKAGGAA
ncbi:MAG: electron transport complex subunit RsxE [Planctomycetota bacterium]|nr:MAG: electron transport complex subunit RsxE [Planctomycetota bacterium]